MSGRGADVGEDVPVHDVESRMISSFTDPIVALDRAWRYAYVNAAAADLFGRRPEQLIGTDSRREEPPWAAGRVRAEYEAALADLRPRVFQDYFPRWSRWYENRVFPSSAGLTILLHELPETSLRGEGWQAFESAREPIAMLGRDLRYRRVNDALANLLQLSRDQILGREPMDFTPPERRADVESRLRRVLAGEVIETPDQRFVNPGTGVVEYISSLLSPLRRPTGEIDGVLVFLRDVTDRILAQEAVQDSERRLRLALEAAQAGVWEWDLRTNEIRWSREHEALWDLPPGSYRGTYEEFARPVVPEDLARVERAIQIAQGSGSSFVEEYRLRRPDGSLRWVAGSGRTTATDTDGPLRMSGTVVDVTARKRAELLVRAQSLVLERLATGTLVDSLEELVRQLHEIAPELGFAIYVSDADERVIVAGLPDSAMAALRRHRVPPRGGDDLASDARWEPERDAMVAQGLRACWVRSLDVDVPGWATLVVFSRLAGPPGEWHQTVLATASHLAGVAHHTARAHAALVESERRYHDLYEHAPDMFLSVDLHTWTIVEHNATLARFTGYTTHELANRDVMSLFHPDDADRARQAYAELKRSGEVRDIELRVRCKDGGILHISLNATATRDRHGRVDRTRSVWRDITQRRRAEDELRKLSAELLRSQDAERRRIARELHDATGQNLAAVAMNLSLLERRVAASEQDLELVRECRELIARSASELRTLSYVLHPPLLEDFGLERMLPELVEGFARRSGLAIDFSISRPFGRLPADIELTLYRVAQEALTNVLRHANAGEARVRLERAGERVVILEVEDHGRGAAERTRREGVGIAAMRERLRAVGGALAVAFGATGTRVTATIRIEDEP